MQAPTGTMETSQRRIAHQQCFFPRADTGFGYATSNARPPTAPTEIGPIFDPLNLQKPLLDYNAESFEESYGRQIIDPASSTTTPLKPEGFEENSYLYPSLASNERLRLTMLWYHTRDLMNDKETIMKMQEKTDMVKSLLGWEFAICGIVDSDVYRRLVTVGLPLAVIPRRESTCSHTILQASGSAFCIPDMSSDWRFAQSPPVNKGGLKSYAGHQLRCRIDEQHDVALGSLCVASNTPDLTLNQAQLDILSKFAEMITEDIVTGSRRKRAKHQEKNDKLLRDAISIPLADLSENAVVSMVKLAIPGSQIALKPVENGVFRFEPDGPSIAVPLAQCVVWEDNDNIERLIRTKNHEQLKQASSPIRAIICNIRDETSQKALVVYTHDMTHIFDDVDSRFVESCTTLLNSIAQEKILQNALKVKDQFMRGITHQLRTPIHGILGSADILNKDLTVGSPSEGSTEPSRNTALEAVQMIKDSGQELMRTVNNVIKYSRWTKSSLTPGNAALIDLNVLELDILQDIPWMVPDEHIENTTVFFDRRIPDNIGIVLPDSAPLKDCIQTLMINALQNTTSGSVILTVSASPDCTTITFDVQDTGRGIALEDQQRIFQAFEKVDVHSKGAGLGLTLACKTAEDLNGAITLVSSELGKGSHFRAEFNDQAMVCPLTYNKILEPPKCCEVRSYCVLSPHSDPLSAFDECFVHFLEARGLRRSDDMKDSLVIVPFTNSRETYQMLLNQAANARIAVSLVPAGVKTSLIPPDDSQILFLTGPFTSDRLNDIYNTINTTCAAQKVQDTANNHLPQVSPSNAVNALTPTKQDPSISSNTTLQCLLVDDNPINLRIFCIFCDKQRLPYKTALDGLQAIDEYKRAVTEKAVNLILLDLQMPKCDGIEACEAIRAFEKSGGLQPAAIFIVTGQDSPSDRQKAAQAGADEFFVKPLSLRNLERAIAQHFLNWKQESNIRAPP